MVGSSRMLAEFSQLFRVGIDPNTNRQLSYQRAHRRNLVCSNLFPFLTRRHCGLHCWDHAQFSA